MSKESTAPQYPEVPPLVSLEEDRKEIPKMLNSNNVNINIESGIKIAKKALDMSEKVFNMVSEKTDEFAQNIEKHRIEKMIALCKYQRKDWTPSEIKDELKKRIIEQDKNYMFVKDKYLDPEETKELLKDPRFKIEPANKDEVIEDLYKDKSVCCQVNLKDTNIKGLDSFLKVSFI